MSFVVIASTSAVTYVPPNGAENAFAGQTIASATWNAIFTDLSNNGLAVLGESPANTIKGNNTGSTAVVTDLTPVQVQAALKTGLLAFPLRAVNFNPSIATDNTLAVSVPTARYMVDRLAITNASGTLTTSVVGLYTATGAGGVTVALSQSLNITSSLADTANDTQILLLNSQSLFALNDATLQFRIVTAQGSAATADVILYVRPM